MQAGWSTVLLGIQGSDRNSCGVGSFYQRRELGYDRYDAKERRSGWAVVGGAEGVVLLGFSGSCPGLWWGR